MKFYFFLAFFCFFIIQSISQNFDQLSDYEFENLESYKNEEGRVLLCTNYIFDNPTDKNELDRLNCLQFIIKWMTGTPNYTFKLGEKSMELTKGNSDLLGLYMAAMSMVVIENTGEKLTDDEIYLQSEKILVNYCADSKNKIKPSKKIRKILKKRGL